MCGIAGIVALRPSEEATGVRHVEAALDRLAHRGPDARGIRSGPGFVFGHARLAIVDPAARSDQPMVSDDGQTVICFNGEIFNHDELRQQLAASGVRFRGASDTEVLLHAWRIWGAAAIERLVGQFAFAVRDGSRGLVHLVRDRVGIKPLYYVKLDGEIMFASEAPALLGHPACARRIDPVGVSSFLSYRQPVGERTLFSGLRQLRPAHVATIGRDGLRCSRYWRVDLSRRDEAPSEERAARMRDCIRHAVSAQVPRDQPALLLLSGGVDSAIIAHEVASGGTHRPVALTAHVDDPDADEFTDAAETARAFGLEHVRVDITERDLFEQADPCIAARGVPLGMHNEVGMHLLARAASSRSKVLLCGEGADELFGGYGRIFQLPFDDRRARAIDRLPLAAARRWARRRLGITEAAAGRDERAFFASRYTYFPIEDKQALFTTEMRRATEGDEPLAAVIGDSFAHGRQRSLFDAVSTVFLEVHLPGLLAMVDGTTMACGVEGRVPFLDERVVQAAFALPIEDKVAWNGPFSAARAALEPVSRFSERRDRTKCILRRAYADVLPAGVLVRRKKGFPMPLARWFGAGPAASRMEAELCGPASRLRDLLDPTRLSAWLRAGADAPTDQFGRQVWQLYTLELFLRRWFA